MVEFVNVAIITIAYLTIYHFIGFEVAVISLLSLVTNYIILGGKSSKRKE